MRYLMHVVEVNPNASQAALDGVITPAFIGERYAESWMTDLPLKRLRVLRSTVPTFLDEMFAVAFRCVPSDEEPSFVHFIGNGAVHTLCEVFKALLPGDPVWATQTLRAILAQSSSERPPWRGPPAQVLLRGGQLTVVAGGLDDSGRLDSNDSVCLDKMVEAWAGAMSDEVDHAISAALDVLTTAPLPAWMGVRSKRRSRPLSPIGGRRPNRPPPSIPTRRPSCPNATGLS